MSGHEFWSKDMSTVHEKKNWFSGLSPQRKLVFVLLLVFVVAWCFFLGIRIAKADDPAAEDWYILTSDGLGNRQFNDAIAIDGIRTFLLVGCDEREGYEVGRSDTMMLVFINGNTGEISLLSIPRDCYVQIPGYSTKTKINHSYAYGGVNLTMSTIEYFLGIQIDDYVEIDFEGFVELVDALDGVELTVDQRMINYDEGINLNPGWQKLYGKDALGYCRFRIGQDGTSSVSDIVRAQHQQQFIMALKDKLLNLSAITKLPKLVTLANKYMATSVSTSEAIGLGNTLLNMDLSNIKTYVIPTYSMWINAVSYEIVDPQGTTEILKQIFGEDFSANQHFIDDGGAGRHSLPAGVQEVTDDPVPEIGDPAETTTGGQEQGAQGNQNTQGTQGNENQGSGNQNQGGTANIPEPPETEPSGATVDDGNPFGGQ